VRLPQKFHKVQHPSLFFSSHQSNMHIASIHPLSTQKEKDASAPSPPVQNSYQCRFSDVRFKSMVMGGSIPPAAMGGS